MIMLSSAYYQVKRQQIVHYHTTPEALPVFRIRIYLCTCKGYPHLFLDLRDVEATEEASRYKYSSSSNHLLSL